MCVCMVSCEITESAVAAALVLVFLSRTNIIIFFPLRSKQFMSQRSRSSQLYYRAPAQHKILIFIMLIVCVFQLRGLCTYDEFVDMKRYKDL